MKRLVLLCVWCFCCETTNAHECIVKDDIDHLVRLPEPAQRVISLAPDITEILFSIGAAQHVVAVIKGSDYPAAALKLPRVGSYSGLDLEKIISLHPDLVVTWNNTFSRQLDVLKKWGIPIYTTKPVRLQDVPRTMKNLGCLLGVEKNAAQVAENYTRKLNDLYAQYHAQKTVSVFYQIGSYSLLTINKDSWINQAIELCGGRNVFANALTITPEIGWEAVVVANPQVILSDATNPNWKERWQVWPQIAAIKQQMLFNIDPDVIDRAGPRLIEGTHQICKYIHHARQLA